MLTIDDQKVDDEIEYDVSDVAWYTYKLLYDNIIIVNRGTRRFTEIEININGSQEKISLSGETDFNFKKGFAHSRLDAFNDIISSEVPEEFVVKYKDNLEICVKLSKSIVNISLMAQTGNLQQAKGGLNDRLDVFIWALDKYYLHGNSNILFNYASNPNIKFLKEYLASYENIYDYCWMIYRIEKSLVDDMIISGGIALDTEFNVMKYMTIAFRFWKQKYIYIKEINDAYPDSKEKALVSKLLKDIEKEINDFY